jgi:hypothetical protein
MNKLVRAARLIAGDLPVIAEDATQIDRHIDYAHVLIFNWLGPLVSLGGA